MASALTNDFDRSVPAAAIALRKTALRARSASLAAIGLWPLPIIALSPGAMRRGE
jgi:hypothetical protein